MKNPEISKTVLDLDKTSSAFNFALEVLRRLKIWCFDVQWKHWQWCSFATLPAPLPASPSTTYASTYKQNVLIRFDLLWHQDNIPTEEWKKGSVIVSKEEDATRH